MIEIVRGIIVGVGSGIASAVLGYAKGKKIEEFEPEAFLKTVFVGAVLGGITAPVTGITIDTLEEFGLLVAITTVVEQGAKIVYRRLKDLWNKYHK